MNPYKNRTADPAQTGDIGVDEVLGYTSAEDQALEQQGVVLRGQMLGFKPEGPESPNCGSATRHDFHIWIGAIADDRPNGDTINAADLRAAKQASVVVELTPNIQDQHPDWAARLTGLRYKHVCVRGWLFFDHDHSDQVGKTRGTQWEVHPITGIGVLESDETCSFLD